MVWSGLPTSDPIRFQFAYFTKVLKIPTFAHQLLDLRCVIVGGPDFHSFLGIDRFSSGLVIVSEGFSIMCSLQSTSGHDSTQHLPYG